MPLSQHESGKERGSAPAAAQLGRKVQIAEADRFAANVLPVIQVIQATGITTFGGTAEVLNARGIPTARGGHWHVSTVRNALRRQSRAEAEASHSGRGATGTMMCS